LLPDAITFPEEFDLAFNHPARRCVPVWLKLHRMPEVHGDKLVSSQFFNSITRGFAAVGEPNVAVCLLPGTELVFDRDVECDHALGLFPNKKLRENVARFRQINLDSPHEHHDALEFPSGQVVLLTRLCGGQRAAVLQLPADTHPAEGTPEGEAAPPVRRFTFIE
jgi:hypothetical protein